MTIKMDRSKVSSLSIACLEIAFSLENEARDPNTSADRREIAESTAAMWHELHDEVRAQIEAWDAKQVLKLGGAKR